MYLAPVLLASFVFGIDVGWHQSRKGGLEYVIQIEPDVLDSLRENDVTAEIPANLRGLVHRYRITVGTGILEQEPTTGMQSNSVPAGYQTVAKAASPPSPTRKPYAPAGLNGKSSTYSGNSSAAPRETFSRPNGYAPIDGKQASRTEGQTSRAGSSSYNYARSKQSLSDEHWFALMFAWAAFFASSGLVFYLGWLAWGYRTKYRALLLRIVDAGQEHLLTEETPLPAFA